MDAQAVAALALSGLLGRRSVSPRRLGAPGPDGDQCMAAVRVAMRAPDHGDLTPWRVLQISEAARTELADLFAQEKRRRDPLVSAQDLERARSHALHGPCLLAFVVCIRAGVTIPVQEQWLCAGAALGNLLNAFHLQGFGAIVLSGERCSDTGLARSLGLGPGEQLAGFVSVGSVQKAPPEAPSADLRRVWSQWQGQVTARAAQ